MSTNPLIKILFIFSLTLLITGPALAKWQCTAMDSNDKSWVRTASSSDIANANALDACRSESVYTWSCDVAGDACEEVKAPATQASTGGGDSDEEAERYWQCEAADRGNRAWVRQDKTEKLAQSRAMQACLEYSNKKGSCVIVKGSCRQSSI